MRNYAAFLFLILASVLGGCVTSDSPVEVGARTLELSFSGERCTYHGPTELSPGPVELLFNNNADGLAAVNFHRLLEGKTIQDVIEYHGDEPTSKLRPSWAEELGTWKEIESGEQHRWEGELEEGNYFMVCANMMPFGVWLGTGITVDE